MRRWVEEVCNSPDDYGIVVDAIAFYSSEYERMRKVIDEDNVRGQRIRDWSIKVPSLSDTIYARWSELKALSDHLDILAMVATQKARKHYIESYNRQLTSYQINDYAGADDEVVQLKQLLLRITLVVNKWEGLSKGLERLHFQIKNIIELRKGGMDEATI